MTLGAAESARKKIVAAVPPDFPPTYFRAQDTGRATGFAVDVMDEVARRAGLEVEYVFGAAWDEIHQLLLSGKADVIPDLVVSEERKRLFLFTSPVEATPVNYIVRRQSDQRLEPRPGMKVGVMKGSSALNHLQPRADLEVVPYDGLQHLLFDLLSGQLDRILTATPNLMKLAAEVGVEDRLQVLQPAILDAPRAMALRPDDRELYQQIESVIKDFVGSDAYRALYEKWWKKPQPYWSARRMTMVAGGVLLASVLGLTLAFAWMMLRLNRRLIRALAETEAERGKLGQVVGALQKSEERFRGLFDGLVDPVYIADHQGRILAVNPRACQTTGYAREELLALTIRDVDAVHDAPEKIAQALAGIPEDGSVAFESQHRRKDGTVFPVEVHTRRFQFDGQPAVVGVARDISDRRRAERALAAETARRRVLFEQSPDGIVIIDPRTARILDFNTAAHRQLGYSREEFARLSVFDLEAMETPEETRARITSVLQGEPADFETVQRTRLGEVRNIHVQAQVVDVEGETLYYCVWRDITERRRAEAALRESEGKYRALVENSGEAIYVVQEGRFVFANASGVRLMGGPADRVVGRAFLDFIHPEDRELLRRRHEERIAGAALPARYEFRVVSTEGAVHDVELNVAVISWNGAPATLNCLTDLTGRRQAEEALRESEERFRSVVESSPLGMCFLRLETDGQLTLLGANPAADRILGVVHRSRLGKPWIEALPPLRESGVLELCGRVARGELGPQSLETLLRHERGSITHEVHVFRTGRDTLAVAFQDVSHRKRLEDQLAQAQKMESIGRLAGGVAHDFNNMLGAILGNVELALADLPPESALRESLQEIQQCAQRSAELTRHLLAFARKQTVAPVVLDLNATVAGMLKMLRRLIGENIELTWRPAADLWPVRVDPSQVDQILANLCVNARDAIGGVGQVTLETANATLDESQAAEHAGAQPGDYVCLALTDTGCGMDREVLGHLFEPFFTTKGPGQGTGLGLATVYGIVQQNQGFIDVQSEPAHGATFRVYLRRHAATSGPTRSASSAPAVGGRETLLLVEDEPAVLRMSRRILEGLGYTVLAASTPAEALRLARSHPGRIDLLMTDVVMPEMNGRDLAQRILEVHPQLKRLFMSGYTADVIGSHGVLGEGTHFLQKPFTLTSLAGKVREVLTGPGL